MPLDPLEGWCLLYLSGRPTALCIVFSDLQAGVEPFPLLTWFPLNAILLWSCKCNVLRLLNAFRSSLPPLPTPIHARSTLGQNNHLVRDVLQNLCLFSPANFLGWCCFNKDIRLYRYYKHCLVASHWNSLMDSWKILPDSGIHYVTPWPHIDIVFHAWHALVVLHIQ